MRTIQVCVLALLLMFAIHEVSAQDDDSPAPDEEHMEQMGDEEPGKQEVTGDEEPLEHEDMEHEDVEHSEEAELSVVDVFKMHGKVDTDQNGGISREELMAYFHKAHKEGRAADEVLEEMEKIDANQDGVINLTEVKEAYWTSVEDDTPEDVAERERIFHEDKLKFTAADVDENGDLNFDEFMSFHIPDERVQEIEAKLRLDEFDKNKDGKLSYHEFEEIAKDFGENASDVATGFTFLDGDGSGFISLEEYVPFELGHFQRDKAITRLMEAADANGDKQLEAEELMAIEKDIIHHRDEHYAIRELVEFSKQEEEQKKAEAQHKDEL